MMVEEKDIPYGFSKNKWPSYFPLIFMFVMGLIAVLAWALFGGA